MPIRRSSFPLLCGLIVGRRERGGDVTASKATKVIEAKGTHRATVLGPTVFALTFAVSLAVCWWVLIYDHGVVPAH